MNITITRSPLRVIEISGDESRTLTPRNQGHQRLNAALDQISATAVEPSEGFEVAQATLTDDGVDLTLLRGRGVDRETGEETYLDTREVAGQIAALPAPLVEACSRLITLLDMGDGLVHDPPEEDEDSGDEGDDEGLAT